MPTKVSRNRRRLAGRASLMIPVLALLGLVLSFIQFRVSVEKVQFEYFKETFESDAKKQLAEINRLINEMVGHLENTADTINIYDDFWHPDVKKILEFSNSTNWFAVTSIADAQGNGYDSEGNTFNVADREYFQTAMKGEVAFSEVMDSKLFPEDQVQIIAHPLRAGDEVRGVVFGVFNVKDVKNIGLRKAYEHDGNVCIVDSCGNYIVQFQEDSTVISGENFWIDLEKSSLSEKELPRIKSEFSERKEGEFSCTYHGEKRYVCHMPIGPNKWQLVYSVSDTPMKGVIHSLYQLDTKNVIFVGVCHLMLLLYVVWHFKQSNHEIHRAHQEAKRNMEFMRISIEHSKYIVFEYDQTSRTVQLKTGVRNKLFQRTVITSVPESLVSMNVIAPGSIPVFERLFETIRTEESCEAEIQIISDPAEDERWYRISMNNVYDEGNEVMDTVGIVEDISLLKKREAAMRKKLQIQDTLIANALLYAKADLRTDTLLELNGEEVHTSFQAFLHRYVAEEVSGEHRSYVEQELSLKALNQAYQQGKESIELEFLNQSDHGFKWVSCVVYRIYMDDTSKVLFVVSDIDDRKRKELALQQQAERDGLTGLYNMATTRLKVNEALSLQHDQNENQIFVLIDLDNYKLINDTFGHDYGDRVLVDIASTLNNRFRSSDIVGRLGGDEFIIFLRDIKSYDYAEHLIDELCKTICRTYREGEKEVTISASVGIAIAPTDGNTFEELYKKSDIAQYRIKKGRKNGYQRYQ